MTRCIDCQSEVGPENKFCKKCGAQNPNFQGRTESDVVIPADETMAWDSNIPSPTSNPPPSNIPSNKININISNQPPNVPLQTQRSGAWYLLPIFFGWIGGLISYFAIRHDDPKKAKNCLILGIVLTVLPFIVLVFLGAVPFF